MTAGDDAETQRIPQTDSARTREYVWPEVDAFAPPAPSAATTRTDPGERPVGPASAAAPLGAIEPEPEATRRKRGNRTAGLLIVALATLVFVALDTVVITALRMLGSTAPLIQTALTVLGEPLVLGATAGFAVGLAAIVLVVNRAGWWAYVLGGFLVAGLACAAALAALWVAERGLVVPTAGEAVAVLSASALLPSLLVPAILARELSVWAGAWIGARGRRIARINAERARAV